MKNPLEQQERQQEQQIREALKHLGELNSQLPGLLCIGDKDLALSLFAEVEGELKALEDQRTRLLALIEGGHDLIQAGLAIYEQNRADQGIKQDTASASTPSPSYQDRADQGTKQVGETCERKDATSSLDESPVAPSPATADVPQSSWQTVYIKEYTDCEEGYYVDTRDEDTRFEILFDPRDPTKGILRFIEGLDSSLKKELKSNHQRIKLLNPMQSMPFAGKVETEEQTGEVSLDPDNKRWSLVKRIPVLVY